MSQAKAIYRFDHWLEYGGEALRQFSHLLVKGLLGKVVIQVSHKMNQALLLSTPDRIMSAVEIGN